MTGNELKTLAVKAYGESGWLEGLARYFGITPRHVQNLVNEKTLHKKWVRGTKELQIVVDGLENIS